MILDVLTNLLAQLLGVEVEILRLGWQELVLDREPVVSMALDSYAPSGRLTKQLLKKRMISEDSFDTIVLRSLSHTMGTATRGASASSYSSSVDSLTCAASVVVLHTACWPSAYLWTGRRGRRTESAVR